jgi:CheY-like chemotaxis protein
MALESGEQNRILVVDDSADVRDTVAELLHETGYEVECAANGHEALQQLRHGERPRLILLNLMMPVMNGWVFRQVQKQDLALASIPIVVMSAVEDLPRHELELEAVAYLRKPVDVEELLATIARICRA